MAPVPKPKRKRTKHFFKEWREFRDLTQEQAIGRLGWSQSKLSRLESGLTPYSQDDIEQAAEAYRCSPPDLIEVNPLVDGEVIDFMTLIRESSEKERRAILAYLQALKAS